MPAFPAATELPLGFAHRGARAECRDNTIASFARAFELGAPALESDAWITAEGVAVLDHDGLVRDGWRRRLITTVRAADLPAHIPHLADLYRRFGTGFHLSLDVKDPGAVSAVVEVAESFDAVDRLWVCTSDLGRLPGWRRRWEKVRLVASTRRSALTTARLSQLAADGVDTINLRDREWDAPLAERVHAAGLLGFGWDAQSPRELDRLLDLGLDGVYSDHVGRMVAALARHRRRAARSA